MEITTYVELTDAQRHTLDGFQRVEVRTEPVKSRVVATFRTSHDQFVKVTMDGAGVIDFVKLVD